MSTVNQRSSLMLKGFKNVMSLAVENKDEELVTDLLVMMSTLAINKATDKVRADAPVEKQIAHASNNVSKAMVSQVEMPSPIRETAPPVTESSKKAKSAKNAKLLKKQKKLDKKKYIKLAKDDDSVPTAEQLSAMSDAELMAMIPTSGGKGRPSRAVAAFKAELNRRAGKKKAG